ncbi:MAG: sigma-54-dependent transcriptional regulator [Candidatus Rokuibacteriota bacterium]
MPDPPPDASGTLRPVVLVVDDDPGLRESFRLILDEDHDVLEAADGGQAMDTVRTTQVDLVLLDIRLPDMDGIQVLEQIKAFDDNVEVILVTAVQAVRTAVAAMKLGAFDYVTKPFEPEEILPLVQRALEKRALDREVVYLRSEVARQHDFEDLVGRHPQMQRLYQLIEQVAAAPVTVLVLGESGTGKELVARAIHRKSRTRNGPFVPVNVAAIPEALAESELFGHERGAFSGAFQKKLGKFELAHGGTLFLDEIATLRVDLQAKILRALQEREIERVGGTRRIKVDVRVVAATNTDLRKALETGALREDLYYRLNVVELTVPPLRERVEDVPLLVEHFIRKYAARFGKRIREVAPGALELLRGYSWPGNVRELSNIVERSVALVDGTRIEATDLPLDLLLPSRRAPGGRDEEFRLKEAREQFERQLVLKVLDRVDWNQSRAARLLGMHRNSLKAKLAGWGIRPKAPQA